MKPEDTSVRILLAEDDDEDYSLTRDALEAAHLVNQLVRVKNGEELLEALRRRGSEAEPSPDLILLDLNMPRMDGREALRAIKSDPVLHEIPVVVLTTSKAEEDVVRSYQLGVNSFIKKPVTFDGLVEAVRILGRYWFEIVELPSRRAGR